MDEKLTSDSVEWRFDDYLHFKKCGIITASPDEKCFGLNCSFCKTICLQFETFIQHIKDHHSRELCALYFTNDCEMDGADEMIGDEDVANEKNTKHNIIINPETLTILTPPPTDSMQIADIEMEQKVEKLAPVPINLKEQQADVEEMLKPLTDLELVKEVEKIVLNFTNSNSMDMDYEEKGFDKQKTAFDEGLIEKAELNEYSNLEMLKSGENSIDEETSSQHSSSPDSMNLTSEFNSTYSKEALNYILNAFKNNELLWNRDHPDYKYNSKKQHFEEIAQNLNADLGYSMTGTDVAVELKKIRGLFRLDLSKLKSRQGLYIPKLWCFEEMEFLRKHMEKKTKTVSNTNSDDETNHLSEGQVRSMLSVDVTYRIIEIYKMHPCLWYVDHPDFRSNTYRKEALNQMLTEINNNPRLNFTIDQLEKILKNLKRNFSLEKKEKIALDSTQTESYTPTFRYYTELSAFLEDNLGPFRCTHCNAILNTSDQYKVHKSTHDGSSPFVCPICSKGFASSGNLTVHLRRHRGDLPFECKECGKRAATTTELAIHMRSHTGERPFVCELCGKDFNSWSFFNIHKRIHLNKPSFVCAVCDKGFYEKQKYVMHMNGHLDIRDFECDTCGKTFTCYNILKKHMEIHEEKKKYKCTICDRLFAQPAGLHVHMKSTHSKVHVPVLRTRKNVVKYY